MFSSLRDKLFLLWAATVAIVEDGKRFTLRALPITPFSDKKEMVRGLLSYAMKFVKIKVVLMDRGFYSGEIIDNLNNAVLKNIISQIFYKFLNH